MQNSFFARLPAGKLIQRGSWSFEVGQLLWMPKGDPREMHRTYQEPSSKLEDCCLRVDWQKANLPSSPLSAAVVFNFKALFTPVTEFRDEAGIPALAAKISKEGKKSSMEYKNTWHVENVILPKTEECGGMGEGADREWTYSGGLEGCDFGGRAVFQGLGGKVASVAGFLGYFWVASTVIVQ